MYFLEKIRSRLKGLFWYILSARRICFKSIGKSVQFLNFQKITVGSGGRISENSKLSVWPAPISDQFITLGKRVVIDRNTELLSHGGYINIENDVFVGPNCQIQGKGGVEIKNGTKIAGGVFIASSDHDITDLAAGSLEQEVADSITIGENCWIGANAVITKGVRIGSNSIVAAGAVVCRNVKSNTIVAGIPAKEVKKLK